MTKPNKVYLDASIIYKWFELHLKKKSKQADEQVIIKFLAEHREIETFISFFTVAEIVAKLRKELKNIITMEEIEIFLKLFMRSTGCQIIKWDKFKDMKDQDREGILISPQIVKFAFECFDASDAIHVDIAKSNDLWFITRDDDALRVQRLYSNVMGESKFRKQFEKKN